MSGNKIGEQMDGWHAIEYASYVTVFDPLCQEYMRLYKQSTKHAAQKARFFIDQMNGERENYIADLKNALDQREKDSTKLQFDMASRITQLEESNAKLEMEKQKEAARARSAEEQFWYMRNVIENQSVALRNISTSLEK